MDEGKPPGGEVSQLARMFAEHPVWREAAGYVVDPSATSDVYFAERPGEAWHLELAGGGATLRPGRSRDPDFVFRFSAEAVRRLAATRGGLADFAIELFESMRSDDPARRVDFRVAAPFARLLRRGYVRLLVAAGPRVVAFGARQGVRGLWDLWRLVESARRADPADWEIEAG